MIKSDYTLRMYVRGTEGRSDDVLISRYKFDTNGEALWVWEDSPA